MRSWDFWYHVDPEQGSSPELDELIRVLRSGGITLRPLNHGPCSKGSGVVFFNRITASLCEFICTVSKNGLCRVLAVSVGSFPLSDAWSLLHSGAADVIQYQEIDDCAPEIALRLTRWSEVEQILESEPVAETLIGRSLSWKKVVRQIVETAGFTDSSILLMGESGTGKELTARLIHSLDRRASKREFIILDCATIIPSLSGSEFFGHERGAFTGAVSSRDGAFALANGGTLFLDEIGELSIELQAQLLRVIQEKTYKRVGGDRWYHTDFRLICATNKDLWEMVRAGRFRADLYYRIAAWTCRLPPLREREGDVLLLAGHFMKMLHPEGKMPRLDRMVEDYILSRQYPGNIRDLKQLITRIMSRRVGSITIGSIPEEDRPPADTRMRPWWDDHFERAIRNAVMRGVGLKEIGKAAEDLAMKVAIDFEEGSLRRAALKLGVTDRTLQLRTRETRMREDVSREADAVFLRSSQNAEKVTSEN